MNTQTLQVFSLRGMDERWLPQPQDALYIQDMTWTANDSWRTSGGFLQVYQPDILSLIETTTTTIEIEETGGNQQGTQKDPETEAVTTVTTTTVTTDPGMLGDDTFGTINSIHWFAQHNGARQWLIFEEVNAEFNLNTKTIEPSNKVTLKAFYGSIAKGFADSPLSNKPTIDLKQYVLNESSTSITNINDRVRTDLSVRTQSQSYGGRIYLVNGSDEPLVFDGEVCERAGFADKPPSPTGNAADFRSSTTVPIAVGDWDDNV